MFGEELIWLFVLGDMCIFAMFFWVYADVRPKELDIFRESQGHLNIHYGSLNTLILLTSSWLVVLAQRHLRSLNNAPASKLLAGAAALGTLFAILKVMEYNAKAQLGLSFESNNFFVFYYLLTGLHLAHVLTGIGLLAWMSGVFRRSIPSGQHLKTFQSVAIFWHMVDLLWIIIFSLIYLLY